MPIPVLLHAVPNILVHALAEQRDASYSYVTTWPDSEPARLALVGWAPDVPAQLAVWRGDGWRAPVLALGAPPEDWPVTESLSLPVRLGQLMARMAYYTQWATEPEAVACGPYRIDLAARKLSATAAEQPLTDKEGALLALLARAPEQMWNREDLLREIWGYDAALETHTLETHIYRLRRKLAELGGAVDIVSGAGGYGVKIG